MTEAQVLDYIPVGLKAIRTKTRCDFSMTALKVLIEEYCSEFKESPWFAILGTQDICTKIEIEEILVPTGISPKWLLEILDCSWCIFGKKGAVYSPGC